MGPCTSLILRIELSRRPIGTAAFSYPAPAQATGPGVIPTKSTDFVGAPIISYSLGQVNCPARAPPPGGVPPAAGPKDS